MLTRRQYAGLVAVVGVTGLLGGGLSSLLVSGRSAQAQEVEKVADLITAREFRLVDKDGKRRARLAVSADGALRLLLFDGNTTARAGLMVLPDGSPNLLLRDKDGTVRTGLAVSGTDGMAVFAMFEKGGKKCASLQCGYGGQPALELRPRDGKGLVSLSLPDGKPYLWLCDKNGDTAWQAP